MRLDDADYRLLALLAGNARLSYRDLAAATGLSTPTVSAKVRAMEEMGLIRGYHVTLDREKLGETQLLLEAKGRPTDLPAIAARLAALPGAREVLLLSTSAVHARFDLRPGMSVGDLLGRLMEAPEILDYRYSQVLRTVKAEETASIDPGANIDLRCHECKGPIHGEAVKATHGERPHWFCCRSCAGLFAKRYAALTSGPGGPGTA